MSGMNWSVEAVQSKQDRWDALSLLMNGQAQEARNQEIERLLHLEEQGELDFTNLLFVRRGDSSEQKLIAAMLVLIRPDQTGMLWVPVFERKTTTLERGLLATQLLQHARQLIQQKGCWIGQFLLEPSDKSWEATLKANGFPPIGTMLHFEKFLTQQDQENWETLQQNACETQAIHSYSEEIASQFEQAIEKSYQQSCDFPEVSQGRSASQALQGHRQVGVFDPENWKLLTLEGQNAGLVLAACVSPQEDWELVYLGLDAEFRGQKLGSFLLAWACARAFSQGGKRMTTGVDSRNGSAVRLYEKLGFRQVSQQMVFAWIA